MLKCIKHITNISEIIKGSVSVPGTVERLTGIAVTGGETCKFKRKGNSFKGYRIRLVVNNRADNPINIDYQDSYLNVFSNVNENVRLIPMDYKLRPQTKIDYIITHNERPHQSIKLYLKFE